MPKIASITGTNTLHFTIHKTSGQMGFAMFTISQS